MPGLNSRNCLAASFALVLTLGPAAWAQYPNPKKAPPPQRPTISPYVNLLRRGNSTAFNYYTLVRPELEFRSQFAQQGAAIYQLRGDVQAQANAASATNEQRPTGHATSFLNYSHYFPGLSGRGGRR